MLGLGVRIGTVEGPTSSTAWGRATGLAWIVGLMMAACQAERPELGPVVAEPSEALRPEALRGPVPEASRVADYVLEARYDEDLHRIDGRARITWRNRGPRPVHALPLHLYMNGFRAEDTAWMKQARGSHRANGQDPEHPWGFITVTSAERIGGEGSDGTPAKIALRHTEAAEPSLSMLELDLPLPPGEAVEIELSFETQLPKVFARTGFSDRYVMAGQWFPKPGVLEPDGTWRTHPFTLYSEFYADFGDYEVYLDLPGDLVVGATGILVSSDREGTRQTLHYRAKMVHDFAWTAGPDMVEAFDEYEGIRIRALLPAEHAADAPIHLEAQREALKSMEARFGPYPWSTITLVEPPEGASGAGGMEYPTFYTTSALVQIPAPLRALGFDLRVDGRFTSIHEFGHQYFQGLFASNEFDQPWLDEGLNTFSNMLVYVDWHGPDDGNGPWLANLAGHPLGAYDGLRLDGGDASLLQVIDQPADHFTPLVGAYGTVTYRKTAATMLTLRQLVGSEGFDAAMRRYADRARFRHPKGSDLEATFIEVLGERVPMGHTAAGMPIELSLPDYFEQALRTTHAVDYRVHELKNRPLLGDTGWHRDEHGTLVGGEARKDPESYDEVPDDELEGIVVVQRRGEFILPVVIEVELADGSRDRVIWDGTGRYRVLRWPGQRIRSVSIDPDRRLVLEGRRWDNTRWARDQDPPASITNAMGQLGEASTLAILGGLGP